MMPCVLSFTFVLCLTFGWAQCKFYHRCLAAVSAWKPRSWFEGVLCPLTRAEGWSALLRRGRPSQWWPSAVASTQPTVGKWTGSSLQSPVPHQNRRSQLETCRCLKEFRIISAYIRRVGCQSNACLFYSIENGAKNLQKLYLRLVG